jgi:hypothetical protein
MSSFTEPVIHIDTDAANVLRVRDVSFGNLTSLLADFNLQLHHVEDNAKIPGSFWGEPEAGIIASDVYVRSDTPIHSLLHEACHLIVIPPQRRAQVHTDASDSDMEEDATCCLQIILAERLQGVGSTRLMQDMDAWGYSFRLGSTRTWFEHDAEDAKAWLRQHDLPA